MFGFPSEAAVNSVKKQFPTGARVECVHINDPYSPIATGTKGTVDCVDDIGTIHIRWDNGRYFGAALGEDKVRRIDE